MPNTALIRTQTLLDLVRLARAHRPELLPLLYSVGEAHDLIRALLPHLGETGLVALERYLFDFESRVRRQL